MAEVSRTLEQMNAAQQRTIIQQCERIKELESWERFASYLINECIGQTVTEENLQHWLDEAQKNPLQRRK